MLREQSKQIQYAVENAATVSYLVRMHQQSINRTGTTHTCYTGTCAHKHTQTEPVEGFLLPACADIQKCQLRRINYASSTTSQHPLRKVRGPQITTTSLHRWMSSSSAVCIHSQKPSPCVWEAARGVLWVCKSVRESERRQGQSVRSSGGNRESVFRMHRWRQCGGSDVAGIITGWRSI